MKSIHKILMLAALLMAFSVMPVLTPAWATDDQSESTDGDKIDYLPRETITIETKSGQDYSFDVEMATTGEQRNKGLMFRRHLNNDSGMLFVFDDEDTQTFWMKNTLIPLDMLFIGRDGVIKHIHHSAKPQDESHITSDSPALAVLEINGGLAGSLGINEGDKVIHRIFRNDLAPQ